MDTLQFCPIEECLIGFVWRRTISPRLIFLFVVKMPEINDPGNAPTRTRTEADLKPSVHERVADKFRLG